MKLIKPPSIFDDIASENSENFTQKSHNRSHSGKHGKKQNTIRMGSNPQPSALPPRQHDTQSVHSNASGKSKNKKAKESSLTRPKIHGSPKGQRDEDNNSVHSTGSRHSRKSTEKVNDIMKRPKIENRNRRRQEEDNNPAPEQKQMSFKSAWKDTEESVIKAYDMPSKKEPEYKQEQRNARDRREHKENKPNNAKYTPFAEIEHQNYSDDEPVHKIQEPQSLKKHPEVLGANRHEIKPKREEESRINFDQSVEVSGQSKIRASKSRRRNIFDKSSIDNTSRVSNTIAESSISGLDDTRRSSSRRKIFKESREKNREDSREKNHREDSRDHKQSRTDMINIHGVPLESTNFNRSNFKPATHQNDGLVQIPRPGLGHDDDFSLDESKSDLNLSTSNNLGRGSIQDNSIKFQFQPEKKKGMSVASKEAKYSQRTSEMVDMRNKNLQSVQENPKEMIKVGPNLISKDLQSVKKILNENEQFLKKQCERQSEKVQIFDFDDSDEDQRKGEKPWHEIVQNYQKKQNVNIKKVQRNEKKFDEVQRERQIQRRVIEEKEKADREQKMKKEKQEKLRREKEEKIRREREERIQQEKQEWLRQQRQDRQRQEMIERERQQRKEQRKRKEEQRKKKEEQRRRLRQEQEERERLEQLQMEEAQKRQAEIFERERMEKARMKKQREIEQKKKEQLKRQKQEERIREEELERQRLEMKRKKDLERQKQKKEEEDQDIPKLTTVVSKYSRDESENKSDHSNKSSRKASKEKVNSFGRPQKHKVYVRNQSPRAEESFYEPSQQEPTIPNESKNAETPEIKKESKKAKLLNFQDDDNIKPKAKTDTNFFDYNQSQKTFKPPSSKPPLSKKSTGSAKSGSKGKTDKVNTITHNINLKDQKFKKKQVNTPKSQKKMTLMERAMLKHNESNDSYSEGSYRSRQDFSEDGSRRSNSSKNSRGSVKVNSISDVLKNKQMIHSKHGNAQMKRKMSSDSSHENQMQEIERRRQNNRYQEDERQRSFEKQERMKNDLQNQRTIVSKNCTFIDQRGRLVQKDLVIKGAQVYGAPSYDYSDQSVISRMNRSREERRKRSSSRDKNKLSRKLSRESDGEPNNDSSSYASSTFYDNSSYSRSGPYNSGANPLRQFIKPVEEVPNYNNKMAKTEQRTQTKTLNDMFVRKTQQNMAISQSNVSTNSRRSMGRTERSRDLKKK